MKKSWAKNFNRLRPAFLKIFKKRVDKCDMTVYTVYIRIIYSRYGSKKERSDDLTIIIDNKSGIPIYEQIYNQVKNHIINNSLKEDDNLPSIRNLAKDLRISVITTKRAYDELEKDGFIYTVAGKGCFVAPKNIEILRENNLKLIEEHLNLSIQLAKSCKISIEDLKKMLDVLSEEE